MITTLPNPKEIRDLLSELLGRDVTVNVADAWAPTAADRPGAAEYIDDLGQLSAICTVDLALAVYLGAAIGLVPPGGAQDMVAEKDPTPMVLGNLSEVLNIVSALFNVAENGHVKLATMHNPGDLFPPPIAELAARLTGRIDLNVEVVGYGKGRLALITN